MLAVSSSRAWFEEGGGVTATVVDGEWMFSLWIVLQEVMMRLSTDGMRGVGEMCCDLLAAKSQKMNVLHSSLAFS